MEQLLAQLLQQRALQTKAESDERHGAFMAQLRRQKRDVGQRGEGFADAPNPEARKRNQAMVERLGHDIAARSVTSQHPLDGMPVYRGHDELDRAMQANDIAAMRERGQPIPDTMYHGLTADDIAGAHKLGSEMNAYGGDPTLTPMMPPLGPGSLQYPVGPVPKADEYSADVASRRKGVRVADEFIRQHGYDQVLFRDMSHAEAAQRIADLLQSQRERAGDPTAWAVLNQY